MSTAEHFIWHTKRAPAYYDAYWQWVKVSHPTLDSELPPKIHDVFKYVYTFGWQYDMQIISAEEFREALRKIAQEVKDGESH